MKEVRLLQAIQILIGLIHVLTPLVGVYLSYPVISGYVLWGGFFFIISGSLIIADEKKKTPCLVKGSVGMNIVSTFAEMVGIVLFITYETQSFHYYYFTEERRLAQGLSYALLIFTTLEFFMSIFSSNFGCKAIYQNDVAASFLPDGVIINQGALLPAEPPPYYEAYANANNNATTLAK